METRWSENVLTSDVNVKLTKLMREAETSWKSQVDRADQAG